MERLFLFLGILVYGQIIAFVPAHANPEIKGTPFPTIPGPKSLDDRIAIVGAGPSGIHMAYRLKKLGFRKVTLYESSGYVGGKSRTITHRDIVHDMGTTYTQPDYAEIYKLVQEFNAGEAMPSVFSSYWTDINGRRVSLLFEQLVVLSVQALRPDLTSAADIQQFYIAAIEKYVVVHTALFGQYPGTLMPRPSETVLEAINMTVWEFMIQHDIEVLKITFEIMITYQGYGNLDEISALYALIWITPNFLQKLVFPPPPEEVNYVKYLSKGFQFLWEEIHRQSKLDVRLNKPVTKIRRLKKGKGFKLVFMNIKKKTKYHNYFDFIILTPSMDLLSSKKIVKFDNDAARLLERSIPSYGVTTLVDTTYDTQRGQTPQVYFVSNIKANVNNFVYGHREAYSVVKFIIGENYTSGKFPGGPDGKFIQSSVYYQVSRTKPTRRKLAQALRQHILHTQKSDILKVVQQLVWHIFPRYSVADLANGLLWDIIDIQGKKGIWYIGSSVSFESVNNVVEYNNMLLRQFDLPKKYVTYPETDQDGEFSTQEQVWKPW